MKLRLIVLSFFLLIITNSIFAGTPKEVKVVNVTGRSFTVVWYTDQAEQGFIEWGSGNTPAYDMRGATVSDNIHIVRVSALAENSEYTYRIKSGGIIYLDNGSNYLVNTGGSAVFAPGTLLSMRNVFKLDSSILVSKDIIIFSRLVNADSQASLPQAIIYKNSYDSFSSDEGYQNYFDLRSFRDVSGNLFSSSFPNKIELLAWTANEGFGDVLTINYAPAIVDIYLNTANLVFYDNGTTTNPVVPTPNPTSNIVTINGILLENFDLTPVRNEFGGYNYSYKNTDSTLVDSLLNEGANGTTNSMKVNYLLQGPTAVFAGYGLNFADNKDEIDLTQYNGIRFFAKGIGRLAVELETTNDVIIDFNHYFSTVTLNADWQEYVVSFSSLSQENWGTKVDLITALKRMVAVKFKAYPQVVGTTGWFQIDEIYLVTGDIGLTTNPITYPKDRVITNFQNSTGQNSWGGYDYSYDDQGIPNFGDSLVTMSIISDGGSTVAFVSYDVNTAFSSPFVGIGFGLDVITTNPQDISRFSGIQFRAKGLATINLEISSTEYADYNRHSAQVPVNSGVWNTYNVYFTDMSQENWGSKVELINVLRNALAVQLKIGKTNDNGQVYIDDVEFFYDKPQRVQNINARVVGGSSLLTWTPSIGATSYKVVRNVVDYSIPGTYPVTHTVGIASDNGTGTTFTEVLDGVKVYYYSVFAYSSHDASYSDVATANRALWLVSPLTLLSSEVSLNQTIIYSETGRILREGDYVQNTFNIIVTVNSSTATTDIAYAIDVVVMVDGVTKSIYVFVPTENSNRLVVPVTLNAGLNNLKVFARDWTPDEHKSNEVDRLLQVADAASAVTLKPGSRVLCSPMPYNPDSIDPMSIIYELTVASDVEIYIYNLLGQVIWKNIYYNGFEGGNAGYNQISFNGVDAFGDKLAIGMYFVQVVHSKSVLGTSKFLVKR